MKRLILMLSFTFSMALCGASTPEVSRHRLGMGGGISLMNDKNAGVGFGATAEYHFRPISQLPFYVGLEASAFRFDTSATNSGPPDLFGERYNGETPMSLSLINFLVRANYVIWDNSFLSIAPTVGYGQSITAETRRLLVPPSFGGSQVTTDTQNRDIVALGIDVGFKLNALNSIVVRPQYQIMKQRNFFTPVVLLTTTL